MQAADTRRSGARARASIDAPASQTLSSLQLDLLVMPLALQWPRLKPKAAKQRQAGGLSASAVVPREVRAGTRLQ